VLIKFDIMEKKPNVGYQPRNAAVQILTARGKRFCRNCNDPILAGERYLWCDSHLSSGYRSDISICKNCVHKISNMMR
jgi:hypothetical protein